MSDGIPVIDDLLQRYRYGAEGTSYSDPKLANRSHDAMHASYKRLRDTAEGRAGIMSLMSDTSPHVRVWAAAHSLQWNMPVARRVLETLRDSGGPCSFTAGITLEEFDRGKLNTTFDY